MIPALKREKLTLYQRLKKLERDSGRIAASSESDIIAATKNELMKVSLKGQYELLSSELSIASKFNRALQSSPDSLVSYNTGPDYQRNRILR